MKVVSGLVSSDAATYLGAPLCAWMGPVPTFPRNPFWRVWEAAPTACGHNSSILISDAHSCIHSLQHLLSAYQEPGRVWGEKPFKTQPFLQGQQLSEEAGMETASGGAVGELSARGSWVRIAPSFLLHHCQWGSSWRHAFSLAPKGSYLSS